MRRTVHLVTTVATALVLAGCSTAVTGAATPSGASTTAPPTAGSAGGEAVTWINGVCGSLQQFVRTVSAPPQVDSSSPQRRAKGISNYLSSGITAADTAQAQLKAAGPAPVESGDVVVSTVTKTLTAFRTSFQDARTRIDAVDPSDIGQVSSALTGALAPLAQLSNVNLPSSPELDRAAQQAPDCQALRGAGG